MTIGVAVLGAAAGGARLAQAHRRLLAESGTQFDLPVYAPSEPPAWLQAVGKFFEALFRFFGWASPAGSYIYYGAIAIVVALVIWFLIANRGAFDWSWRRRPRDDAPDWQPDVAEARALLADAEALAAQGRFAEAARLLLRRSVEDIAQRVPEFLKPSLTARDIAGAPALPDRARPAFAAIARVVEVSAFGARSVSAAAWDECRAAYARFALPENWAESWARG